MTATITPIAAHESASRRWPRTTRPTSAARTGFTLITVPNTDAGTWRSVSRSASIGTADDRTPAVTAARTAPRPGRCAIIAQTPTGTYASPDAPAAAAEPATPGMRAPTARLSRM
ncbi:hypothetical protein Amsp01_062370 [Amycolatopsis sp. NBRC 101858]|nr:hypothetical protein Amsp01_062370 [Amycolatopsis sp. NBRC 101858]